MQELRNTIVAKQQEVNTLYSQLQQNREQLQETSTSLQCASAKLHETRAKLHQTRTSLQHTVTDLQLREDELEDVKRQYHAKASQMKSQLTEQKQEHETVVQQLGRELRHARNMLQV